MHRSGRVVASRQCRAMAVIPLSTDMRAPRLQDDWRSDNGWPGQSVPPRSGSLPR